ncbi:MAG: hypothetical protein ACO3A4_01515 [Silvanigrellaceae bacterium]
MRNPLTFFVAVLTFVVHLSCGKSSNSPVTAGGGHSWQLSLQLPGGYQLTDNSTMLLDTLKAQLDRISIGRTFFRDPVELSEKSPFGRAQMLVFGDDSRVSLSWKSASLTGSSWRFGTCGGEEHVTACEYQSLLKCLQDRSREDVLGQESAGTLGSNPSRSLLLEWFRRCGVSSAFGSALQSQTSFAMRNNNLYFEPSPLLSLLIYPGAWTGYEDAVIQSTPVATVPALVPCSRGDGACLESPLPVGSCNGCANLQTGKLYTVFFVEALRQDYSTVRSIVYVP